ncbi:MAG: 50S ribosomal protein L24 [Alphaproteobacteria bacterium]
MAKKIKKGDTVQVLSGRDAGKRGDVMSVDPKTGKAIVRDVNTVSKHNKPQAGRDGGIETKAMPIQLSNLSLIDPADDKPVRVGFKMDETGKKVRFAKRSGQIIA